MSKIGQAALSPEKAGVLDYLPSKEKDCQSQNLQTKTVFILTPLFGVINNLSMAEQNKNDPILTRITARVDANSSGDDGDGDPLVLTQDNDAEIFFLFLAGSKIASS